MITLEDWEWINHCVTDLPKRFRREFFEEVLGFEQVEIDGLQFNQKTVSKNYTTYLSEIYNDLTMDEKKKMFG